MASLIEELITTLEQEYEIYQNLVPIEENKTKIIIKGDIEALQQITEQEQAVVEKINHLERKRGEVVKNIGTVINKDPNTLRVQTIIDVLDKQPEEQMKLSKVHENLKKTVQRLVEINNQNNSLIQQSLEMIEFNMNFITSARMNTMNNSYNKGASQFDMPVMGAGIFDTKQ